MGEHTNCKANAFVCACHGRDSRLNSHCHCIVVGYVGFTLLMDVCILSIVTLEAARDVMGSSVDC
jgi:hypothetical protein